jgi:hypothetical protein
MGRKIGGEVMTFAELQNILSREFPDQTLAINFEIW